MANRHLLNILFSLLLCLNISSLTAAAAKCRPQSIQKNFGERSCTILGLRILRWEESADCCSWEGVTCHPSTGTIIALRYHLSCNAGTSATFTSNSSLFQLTSLLHFDLAYLNLQHATIPKEIAKLTQLRTLVLKGANLSGPIPDAIESLVHLETLNLGANSLSGSLPLFIPRIKNLHILRLYQNSFTGTIPAAFFSHQHLWDLDLSSNQLRSPLPATRVGSSNLTGLDLSENKLDGTVPSWVFAMPRLVYLGLHHNNLRALQPFRKPGSSSHLYVDLSFNNITGPIPSSLLQLVNLYSLNLQGNQLTGVVEWNGFKKLVKLSTLYLSSNRGFSLKNTMGSPVKLPFLYRFQIFSCGLTEFPEFLSVLDSLEELDVSDNRIKGAAFQQSGWTQLKRFDGSRNQITAIKFPNSIIDEFFLRNNLIRGPLTELPLSISALSLENNQLSGRIPSLMNLQRLSYLNLSYNSFVGLIPPTTFSNDSFIGNPGLCGLPLTKPC